MKKSVIIAYFVLSVFALVLTSVYFHDRGTALLIYNVEALSQSPESLEGESACRLEGGIWDHYSTCEDGGIITTSCTTSGEITAFGVTLKGSYQSGCTYYLAWARYSCEHKQDGYCCTEQGIYVNGIKVS